MSFGDFLIMLAVVVFVFALWYTSLIIAAVAATLAIFGMVLDPDHHRQ